MIIFLLIDFLFLFFLGAFPGFQCREEEKDSEESTYKAAIFLLDQSKDKEHFNLGEVLINPEQMTLMVNKVPLEIPYKKYFSK